MTTDGLPLFDLAARSRRLAERVPTAEGDAAVEIALQTCRRCGHWRAEHVGAGSCERLGCLCARFVETVETIDLADFDPGRLARRSDPASSHKAARDAIGSGRVRGHEELILRALRLAGRPLTAKEIGERVGLTNVQVCRRLGEKGRLRRQRLIRRLLGHGEQQFEAVR